jgi:hypothetical protein
MDETKENRHIHSWFEERPRVNSKKQKPEPKTPLLWKIFVAFTVTFIVGAYIDGSFFEHSESKFAQVIIVIVIVFAWISKEEEDDEI